MFGRRRHAAPAAVAPTPQLSDERIFELVHARLAAAIGEHGEWTLTRRTQVGSDDIFHGVLAHSIAVSITDALRDARGQLATAATSAIESVHAPEHVAQPQPDSSSDGAISVDDPETAYEPAAFRWDPAPITIWTDLKKPVTGELARVDRVDSVELVA